MARGELISLTRAQPRALPRIDPALAPSIVTGLAFSLLFWNSALTLVRDWWSSPDAGHGLLLAPVAIYLGWRAGRAPRARPQPLVGLALLTAGVLLRYVSELAAELYTMRLSMLIAAAGLAVFVWGVPQLLHWWLPGLLLLLSVPLPAVVLGSLALPLQLQASEFGASLLAWRYVPVRLTGNVIHLPGASLFVTEACSGLRSLTALISLGVLIGGLWLRAPISRLIVIAAAIPVAMFVNGIRIFLTGFFVYYIDPSLAEGLVHYTEGWALFVAAFLLLGALAALVRRVERAWEVAR